MPRRNLPPAYEDFRYLIHLPFLKAYSKHIEYLRIRLRRSPNWLDGHLALARETAKFILAAPVTPHSRDYSTLRLSCQAAKRLLGKDGEEIPSSGSLLSRQEGEIELSLSLLDFAEKRFRDSLTRLERVLEEKNAAQISGRLHRLALEYAASAAHFVGDREKAVQYLSQIPSQFWNRDLQTLQQVLSAEKSEQRA